MKQEKEKIPKGFKSSEVGIIPADWDLLEVKDVFEYINTTSFSRENLTYDKTESQVYYIHYGDIHATFKFELLDFDVENELPFLKDEYVAANFTFLKDGDLVMADASEDYEGVGKSIELKNIRTKKVISGLHTFALRDNSRKTVRGYRTYMFNNFNVSIALRKIATGSSVYGISKGNLSKLKLPIPPSTEQTSIANCLSTWDKAIEKTEALLAQKEKRKKWLMRMLLTGKKRLKGFEKEKWRDEVLANLASIKTGKKDNQNKILNGKYPFFVRSQIIERIDSYSFDGEAILIPGEGNVGEIFHYIDGKFDYHQRVYKISDFKDSLDGRFCYYYLKEFFKKEVAFGSVKATVDSLRLPLFLKMKFRIPPIKEQKLIAKLLHNADEEIELQKIKLQELKNQKQGLMQVLLTGKKRLKIK